MSRFIIVRHGETAGTHTRRYHGVTDIVLSSRGKKQARQLSRYLSAWHFDYVYCSPLQRCLETARLITGKRDIPFLISPLIREIDFGAWEGLTLQEMHKHDPVRFRKWFQDVSNSQMPGGETVREMIIRIEKFWRFVNRGHPDADILVVTHGGPAKLLLLKALGLPWQYFWGFRISTASVSFLDCSGQEPILRCFNARPGPLIRK